MTTKKVKSQKVPKIEVNPPKDSAMDRFHQAMNKIVSIPKKNLKDK